MKIEYSKAQVNIGRFTWYFDTGGARPIFKVQLGCDEYHNKSKYVIMPLIGTLCWFTTWNKREVPEHIYGYFSDAWQGYDDPDCDICKEIKESINEHSKRLR